MKRFAAAAVAGLLTAIPVSFFTAAAWTADRPFSDRLALIGVTLMFGLPCIVGASLRAFTA